jgi:Ni,Fe-hydrogenase III large subunit
MKKPVYIKNNSTIALADIPILSYEQFSEQALTLLAEPDNHCVCYYAFPRDGKLQFICCIACDVSANIALLSHVVIRKDTHKLVSLSRNYQAMQQWEREIAENFGISFQGHPWPKPVRFAHDRAHRANTMDKYPFYRMESEELHEVGVGPIHAGIIEPGHFRFICHGETVLNLEIQLGYQHRGVERLLLEQKSLLQQTVLAESLAGDTTIGHTLAFVLNVEALAGIQPPILLTVERTIALELERIAVHTGDLSALCTDVAYQFGSAVLGALRTPVINFMQLWCGNRFGKGLIRVGQRRFPLTVHLRSSLLTTLNDFEKRFSATAEKMFSLPSVLHRFEKTGILTRAQADAIGVTGMVARSTGIQRDIRRSHPFGTFLDLPYEQVTLTSGDVYSRAYLRKLEIDKSLHIIRTLLERYGSDAKTEDQFAPPSFRMPSGQFALTMVEGWRGEICHCAVTGEQGRLQHYKVVDPSFRNWLALALAVRNNEISDFPVCNKSFNLSYCGHDL